LERATASVEEGEFGEFDFPECRRREHLLIRHADRLSRP
jgi:hypothetical protein